jgi:hypothetical protein
LEIIGGSVIFAEGGEPDLTIIDLEGNDSMVLEMILTEDVTDHQVQIIVSHLQVMQAQVLLDMTVFSGGQTKDIHVGDGDRVDVHYTVWDADTGEELDQGDLIVTAGNDPAWIEGFGWSAIGLDIDGDRGLLPGIDTGTSHTTLLPPGLAYDDEGDELQGSVRRAGIDARKKPPVAVYIESYCRPPETLNPCRIITRSDNQISLIKFLPSIGVPHSVVDIHSVTITNMDILSLTSGKYSHIQQYLGLHDLQMRDNNLHLMIRNVFRQNHLQDHGIIAFQVNDC